MSRYCPARIEDAIEDGGPWLGRSECELIEYKRVGAGPPANVSLPVPSPTNSVGDECAFEMHPEGAPPGNRYQSAQVAF